METHPVLHAGQWNLIVLPQHNTARLLAGMARLAADGPLLVLDCGRQYDPSIVARAARGRAEIIDRIRSQRAFICSEVVELIQRTPAAGTPIVILDFLSTFYDENVKMHMRRYLLEASIKHFRRLSRQAGLAVTVRAAASPHDELHQRLRASAPRVSVYENPAPYPGQLGLF